MNLWEVIDDLSYKPGWKYTLNYRSTGRHSIWVTAKVQHSTTLEWVTFDFERMIPQSVQGDLAGFLTWIEDITLEAEFHELREFLRYKGELVNNPHASAPVDDTVPAPIKTEPDPIRYVPLDLNNPACPECHGPLEFAGSNGLMPYYKCAGRASHNDPNATYTIPLEAV
jgi:hypothetical protein